VVLGVASKFQQQPLLQVVESVIQFGQ